MQIVELDIHLLFSSSARKDGADEILFVSCSYFSITAECSRCLLVMMFWNIMSAPHKMGRVAAMESGNER